MVVRALTVIVPVVPIPPPPPEIVLQPQECVLVL